MFLVKKKKEIRKGEEKKKSSGKRTKGIGNRRNIYKNKED